MSANKRYCHCGDEMGKGVCVGAPHVQCKERTEIDPPEPAPSSNDTVERLRTERDEAANALAQIGMMLGGAGAIVTPDEIVAGVRALVQRENS